MDSRKWWNQLENRWKEIFIEAIGIEDEPNDGELVEIIQLQELDCHSNQISDLEPLRQLTNLREFVCRKRKNRIARLARNELLIVMVILGMLAAIVGPNLWNKINGGQKQTAKIQIANIETALGSYRLDMFKYPNSLEDLVNNTSNDPKWLGPYLTKGLPKDPWGNDYQYRKPGQQGRDYDLYSFGVDGQEGGEGENADIVSWQNRRVCKSYPTGEIS